MVEVIKSSTQAPACSDLLTEPLLPTARRLGLGSAPQSHHTAAMFVRAASALVLSSAILAGCSVLPESERRSEPAPRTATQRPAIAPDSNTRACLARLSSSGAQYSALADQYRGPGCATLGTVQMSAVAGDSRTLPVANLGPVACPLAQDFAAWARYGVDRAARQMLGSALVRIETMGSYSCRNVAGSSRRSAHSTANAIDVSAFVLSDGRRVTVTEGWNDRDPAVREFLRVIHRSACKRFGTVLGPDYNSAHHDHFHVESSGSGFCR